MKWKFTSNIITLFDCLMLGWLRNLIKILSIASSLVFDGGTLEESSVHMCRSSDSTMDPKYSLNVLAKVRLHFTQKDLFPWLESNY